jgi:hypothetical protein
MVNNEIISIKSYQTDSGHKDLGEETVITGDTDFSVVLKRAIDLKAFIIVKSSYVCETRPGQYYIKGYKTQKTYNDVKELLEQNILDNKFTKVKTWLIEYDDIKHKYNREELINENISYSKIVKCKIWKNDDIISKKTTYRSILIDIWKKMPIQKIFQNTSFNIKLTDENGGMDSYNYEPSLKFYFQNKSSNDTFKEIMTMIELNKYKLDIEIILQGNKCITYEG